MVSLTTLGYAHKDAQATLDGLHAQGGYIVDIRLNPVSKLPGWNARELTARYGLAYVQMPDLGNVNHHSGRDIALRYKAQGLMQLAHCMRSHDAVTLLCGCMWADSCHRLYVAQLAQAIAPELEPIHLLQGGREAMIKFPCAIPAGMCAYMQDGALCPLDSADLCNRCHKPVCDVHTRFVAGLFSERIYPYCPRCYEQHLDECEGR